MLLGDICINFFLQSSCYPICPRCMKKLRCVCSVQQVACCGMRVTASLSKRTGCTVLIMSAEDWSHCRFIQTSNPSFPPPSLLIGQLDPNICRCIVLMILQSPEESSVMHDNYNVSSTLKKEKEKGQTRKEYENNKVCWMRYPKYESSVCLSLASTTL